MELSDAIGMLDIRSATVAVENTTKEGVVFGSEIDVGEFNICS